MTIKFEDYKQYPKQNYGSLGTKVFSKETAPEGGYYQAPKLGDRPYEGRIQAKDIAQGQAMEFRRPKSYGDVMKERADAHNAAIEADRKAFRDSHQGLSDNFNNNMADLLRDLNHMTEGLNNHTYGAMSPLEQAEARFKDAQDWEKQDPMSPNMGYEWADDETFRKNGMDEETTALMKARHMFHPQEIEELRKRGILRAPFADYLAKQAETRRQAEAEAQARAEAAARTQHSRPSYSGGGGGYSAPAAAPPSRVSLAPVDWSRDIRAGNIHPSGGQPTQKTPPREEVPFLKRKIFGSNGPNDTPFLKRKIFG